MLHVVSTIVMLIQAMMLLQAMILSNAISDATSTSGSRMSKSITEVHSRCYVVYSALISTYL